MAFTSYVAGKSKPFTVSTVPPGAQYDFVLSARIPSNPLAER